MRHEPLRIDRVACEAAADMVVDAALADGAERREHGCLELLVAGALESAPKHVERVRIGEFRGPLEAAAVEIPDRKNCLRGAVEDGRINRAGRWRDRLVQVLAEGRGVLGDGVVAGSPRGGNCAEHLAEARAAVARLGRKIGAAPKRLAVGRQEHRQRPATLLAQRVQRPHVDLVDLRPLLAVDLDRHEVLVEHLGGGRIGKALRRHDVTPMAGGVADREVHRHVAALRVLERLWYPRPPVDGIVGMLTEIGAG